jgi:hypothetical protein
MHTVTVLLLFSIAVIEHNLVAHCKCVKHSRSDIKSHACSLVILNSIQLFTCVSACNSYESADSNDTKSISLS